jgi:ABC-2 type transport system permease protein
MLRSVALKTLRDTRRALAWWSLGIVALVALLVSVYPSVRDNPGLNRLVQDYPQAVKGLVSFGGRVDYGTAPGYLGSELFALMVPLILIIAAVGAGTRALAGEEERGTLDLLLANPVSRRRLVLEKLAALAAELALLALVLWLTLLVGTAAAGMDVSAGHLAAACADALVLAAGYGSIALAVGAFAGRRAVATGVAAAAAVAGYLVNSLAPLVSALEPLRKASPFYHYAAADPLRRGLEAGRLGLLLLVVAVAGGAATALFERRDLTA